MPKQTSQDTINKIRELRAKGLSYDAILKEKVGAGKQTVMKICQEYDREVGKIPAQSPVKIATSKTENSQEHISQLSLKNNFKLPVDVEVALMDLLTLRNFKNFQPGGTNQSKAKSLDTIATWLQSLRE